MSVHGNADSPDSEAAPTKMGSSDATNGNEILQNGRSERSSRSPLPPIKKEASADDEAAAMKADSDSGAMKDEHENTLKEETISGEIVVKQMPGQPPKLSRSSSQKVVPRPPQLFSDLPDSTADALATFEQMDACWYANKYMGYTEHAMECDCAEEWDSDIGRNLACGDDSDCINRATKIECVGDCGCGPDCQNQRFQKKEYAKVSVIKTEKKGFGLRAESNLEPHQLIFEYVGEVVGEQQFRRRMRQYDEEGIKHFYFMSLNKGEFVDATKRGNLGRFCNHSCNPNCYVDKWVVGEKLRMGIFAERAVQIGEELVFNYNVDRYGADPQPCYCGEPNCTGFIGGRTQTERATKLSNATIEALGIDDADGWDTVVARRPRKRKTEEDDEEYVDSVQPKSLDEDGVTKVMAALMQCQEKWIAVKLLGRIQRCEDERVRNRVVKMHGYQILNSQLAMWKEDHNVMLQILDILDTFPRLTRNKIIDSKIETNIQPLTNCGDEHVEKKAVALLASWANLEVGYRIPRMKRGEQQTKQAVNQFERRESGREGQQQQRSKTRSPSPIYEPQQQRGHGPPRRERNPHNHGQGRSRRDRRNRQPLPEGWFTAEADGGRMYYYSASGETTWNRPTAPATPQSAAPPPANKQNLALQSIIDGIINSQERTPSEQKTETPGTPQPSSDHPPEKKKKEADWWKKLSLEKQKKLYENTLHPHIKHVVDQYKHKIPKDHLKRFAKETAKKLVEGDYKKQRVTDPTKISEKHQQTVKSYCKSFFDKAASKHKEREKRKAEKGHKQGNDDARLDSTPADDPDVKMSDDEADTAAGPAAASPMDDDASFSLKRKRNDDSFNAASPDMNGDEGADSSPSKRHKSTPPPPPPPPPPIDPSVDDSKFDVEDADDSVSPPPVPPSPPKSLPETGVRMLSMSIWTWVTCHHTHRRKSASRAKYSDPGPVGGGGGNPFLFFSFFLYPLSPPLYRSHYSAHFP
ncbi:Histone-lysine N-methyltransferase H3 lysine-36 specific [Penicillium macrosclerotiorum]|uniref:Histone-lysine N-methyltransferase H3 lysine-36 specific n=1 Tax=Penicillium macrosclerotiorum TaxID=303699 RepID=UPI002547A5D0|nr:Histone-lysine N-methyltransferase H3 lysine-36 specific [Penicillium macrosclerotiorum]KAJ5693397.1 Histone-lysine N-methyltransferase H3 lysine-36 specific [Penicillium macrosclerotiorum]